MVNIICYDTLSMDDKIDKNICKICILDFILIYLKRVWFQISKTFIYKHRQDYY